MRHHRLPSKRSGPSCTSPCSRWLRFQLLTQVSQFAGRHPYSSARCPLSQVPRLLTVAEPAFPYRWARCFTTLASHLHGNSCRTPGWRIDSHGSTSGCPRSALRLLAFSARRVGSIGLAVPSDSSTHSWDAWFPAPAQIVCAGYCLLCQQ